MKYVVVLISSCAIGMTASSAAYADYSIIRWTSGFCQIWDNSTPWKPFPSGLQGGPHSVQDVWGCFSR